MHQQKVSRQPSLPGLERDRPHRVFVITRPLVDDVTATYLLRAAWAATRRGDQVTLVVSDRALNTLDPIPETLRPLLSSRAQVMIHAAPGVEHVAANLGSFDLVDDPGLAQLLLTPGIEAQWC